MCAASSRTVILPLRENCLSLTPCFAVIVISQPTFNLFLLNTQSTTMKDGGGVDGGKQEKLIKTIRYTGCPSTARVYSVYLLIYSFWASMDYAGNLLLQKQFVSSNILLNHSHFSFDKIEIEVSSTQYGLQSVHMVPTIRPIISPHSAHNTVIADK